MPNWSCNTLAIKGKKENVLKMFNDALKCSNRAEVATFDELKTLLGGDEKLSMRSWMPMPKTFAEFDTTNQKCDFKEWLMCGTKADFSLNDDVVDFLRKIGKVADVFEDVRKLVYEDDDTFKLLGQEFMDAFNEYSKGYDDAVVYQKETYGVVGWYAYNLRSLGVKWDTTFNDWLFEEYDDEVILRSSFDTAWSIPNVWIDAMYEDYGQLVDMFIYADEEGGAYCGYAPFSDLGMIDSFEVTYDMRSDEVRESGVDEDSDEFYDRVNELVEEDKETLFMEFLEYVREA